MYLMLALVPGSVLSALHSSRNYKLNTHDYNSVSLGSVYIPPAGTNSFQPSLWKHQIQTLSFSFSLCLLLWVHLSPPSLFQVIESNSELEVTTKIMKCSGFWTQLLGFLVQGHLRKRSRTQALVLLRPQLSAEIHAPGTIKEFRVRGQT